MSEETQGLKAPDLRVKDVMTPSPLTVDINATIAQVARGMEECECGCCLVEQNGKIVGIVTERDIVRRVAARGGSAKATRVKDIMSSPIIAVDPEATVEEALKAMANNKVRRLVVVADNGLVGIVSIADIAKALAKKSELVDLLIAAITRESKVPEGVYQ